MDQNQQNGFFNPNEATNYDLNQQNNTELNQVQQQFNQTQQQFTQPQQQFNQQQFAQPQQQFNQFQQQSDPYSQYQQPMDPLMQEYQAPVFSGDFKPLKKKFNPLVIILPVIVLIIAAVAIFLIFFNKSSYEKSEKKFFSDIRNSVLSSVDETQQKVNSEPQALSLDVTLPNEFASYLGGISNVGFEVDAIGKDNNVYGTSSFSLGDAKIDFECWIDNAGKIIYMFLPEASDIYLKVDTSEIVDDTSANSEKTVDYDKLAEALLNVVDKTSDLYYEEIGDVKTEKNQEFTIETDTYSADKAVIHLNAAQMAKIVSAFRDNLLADDEAMNLLTDACGYESVDELKNEINETFNKEKLDTIIAGEANSAAFDMNVYMKNNQIVGREITVTNDDLEKMDFDFFDLPADNGEEIVYLRVYSEDSDDVDVKLYIKNKEENKANSGTASLSVNGEAFNVSYNDLAVSNELFQGTITASMEGEAAFTANVELKTEGETKTIAVKIPNICTITASLKPSDIQFKDLPSDSSKFAEISAEGDNYDDENFQQFTDDLYNYLEQVLEPILNGISDSYGAETYDDWAA